ncbi:MAG: hypothetical protein Q7N50_07270 [Armatimonadota bacterium]|nr:hypothetical protein [Armatimonadota bacterium]
MEREARKDLLARVVGMLVLVAGIGILVFVFVRAYILFSSPAAGLIFPTPSRGVPPTTSNLSGAALALVAQIGLLFIMTLVGSLLASRGIQLYLACEKSPKS